MITKNIKETLLFYMKLAKVNHGNNVNVIKEYPQMHDFVMNEIQGAIDWLEAQPIEPKFKFGEKVYLLGDGSTGHVIKMIDDNTVRVCWDDGVVLDEMVSIIELQPTEQGK